MSSELLLHHYNLKEQPFGVTPDPRFLYFGAGHREAFASLIHGTACDRGFLTLIAPPGMGKTSILYHYLSYLRNKARTAFVFRTDCNSREFIRHVLLDLGIDANGLDLPAMHEALNRILTDEMRAGRRFVLVIDEAQNLSEKTLESIRLLSNFETPWAKLMLIVLAGQPQLAERLGKSSLAQLRQRISMVIRIKPLTTEEVSAYIEHRLWVAGGEGHFPFTDGAKALIVSKSRGVPREINNLCFNAMSLTCALRKDVVDRAAVSDVIADLELSNVQYERDASFETAVLPEQEVMPRDKWNEPHWSFGRWLPKAAAAFVLLILTLGCPSRLGGGGRFGLPDSAYRQRSSLPDIPRPSTVNQFQTLTNDLLGDANPDPATNGSKSNDRSPVDE